MQMHVREEKEAPRPIERAVDAAHMRERQAAGLDDERVDREGQARGDDGGREKPKGSDRMMF
jgi:hypothetical protein